MEIRNFLTDDVKSLGIMLYVDNSPKMLEEFSWLYKSWIYSGCYHTSDLLVVHHPEVGKDLPNEPGIILIPCLPKAVAGTPFEDYHFYNSIGCLSGEHVDATAAQYEYLLRTDADVFLTRHLADFRPSFPVHGRGLYHSSDDFKNNMLNFCQRHGVKHFSSFGCGSSLLASSDLMLPFLRRQIHWCEVLLEAFGKDEKNWGKWPGWFRGVTTMYAAEIAANEAYWEMLYRGRERILDVESDLDELIDSMTLHIHAVTTDRCFSKYKLREGEYQSVDPDALDRSRIPQYCQWLALATVEQVKQEVRYPW
ncbi:hypothetical protein [Pantoea sp. BAV 3049]|uniref:DUF7164 domain-containing protein n=1 Tax=Pantoea sp. BAV 3049 TaxID=2654188 RepID=UPI00131ED178|nr:hypothetical protein [Pantoea sp. BAV 3049]